MNVHENFEEKVVLAKIYAEDGAFTSSARVLSGLAEDLKAHAKTFDEELVKMLEDRKG